MLLTYFPLSDVAATNSDNKGGRLGKGESAHIIMPLTQWGAQNPDRLAVMRMLLEQGCDPNDKASYGPWAEFMTARQSDTALHLAAELGDEGMVDLLLEFGARADLTGGDGEGDTPASRARAHGHPQIAARIEG
jgi:ankyrin repeat protein